MFISRSNFIKFLVIIQYILFFLAVSYRVSVTISNRSYYGIFSTFLFILDELFEPIIINFRIIRTNNNKPITFKMNLIQFIRIISIFYMKIHYPTNILLPLTVLDTIL